MGKVKLKGSELHNLISESVKKYFEKYGAVNYSTIRKPAVFSNPLTYLLHRELNEGLIRTYPIDKTISYVKYYFDLKDDKIGITNIYGIDYIFVEIPNIGENRKIMEKAMNLCGYFLSHQTPSLENKNEIVMQFEPKYQKDITDELRQEERYLYHITPRYNLKKIKKSGLLPKTRNDFLKYPGRVYFIKASTDYNETLRMGYDLSDKNNSKGNKGNYAILLIDVTKIPSDVVFYEDGSYPYGVFTYDNISSDCIVGVNYVDYDKG